MRVKCIANRNKALPKEWNNIDGGGWKNREFDLIIDKEYLVFAISVHAGFVSFCLCDESYTYYPLWNPAPLFEVVDGSASRYWKYHYFGTVDSTLIREVLFAFKEWGDDQYFYGKLVDAEDAEKTTFRRYKALMELEFPDPSVEKMAKHLTDRWVMCPNCDESWEDVVENGLVKCPKCHEFLNNPLYSPINPE
jgi:hypothetical protein